MYIFTWSSLYHVLYTPMLKHQTRAPGLEKGWKFTDVTGCGDYGRGIGIMDYWSFGIWVKGICKGYV